MVLQSLDHHSNPLANFIADMAAGRIQFRITPKVYPEGPLRSGS